MRCGPRWPRMTRCCVTAIEARGCCCSTHAARARVPVASPSPAVDAAVAAQRSLKLPVRMGLATGEAELRDADYFGTVLNRAARVMAAGHGGQILLAESTGVLLQRNGSARSGAAPVAGCADAGRGVSGPSAGSADRLSCVTGARYKSWEPAPAATSFIGRDAELAEVQAALREHRVMTLTGVGGVGKTRLAQEVGRISCKRQSDRGGHRCGVGSRGLRSAVRARKRLLLPLPGATPTIGFGTPGTSARWTR